MKNNGIYDYQLEQFTEDGKKEMLGNVKYSENFGTSKKRPKRLTIAPFLAGVIASTCVFGGVRLFSYGVIKADELVKETKQEFSQVSNASKRVAYTNYTQDEINKLSFTERIEIYNGFIEYVINNATIPPIYGDNIPADKNYVQLYNEAKDAYDNFSKYGATLSPEVQEKEINAILSKYHKALVAITIIHHDAYNLYITGDEEDYNVINVVNNAKTL